MIKKMLMLALGLTAGAAHAGVGTLPGSNLDRPGSSSVGAPMGSDSTDNMFKDSNGDGVIQREEVTPGSQLAKRFDRRDVNHDGQLTRDEYYLP